MINKKNGQGVVSSSAPNRRGNKGHQNIFFVKDKATETYRLIIQSYGGYGKLKNEIVFSPISHDEFTDMIISQKQLLRGEIDSTEVPLDIQPEPADEIPEWAGCDGCGKCQETEAMEVDED